MNPTSLLTRFYSQTRLWVRLIITRVAGKKAGFLKSFLEAVPSGMAFKLFKKQPLSRTYKNCPNCDGQVPLAALFCDACDYNFVASMVGHRHKLLNPPTISEAADQILVGKVPTLTERFERHVKSTEVLREPS